MNWLTDRELKDWVKQNPSNKCAAICIVREWKLKNCNKSALMKHKASSKHKNFEAKKNSLNIQQFFKKLPEQCLQDKVAKIELLLSGYVVEHGVPFGQCDHLVDVIKKMFPDSEVARNI